MQYDDIIGVDAQPHLLVQQAIGFLFGEGELLGTYLVHLSPREPPPQRQRRVGAAGDDEGYVLGGGLYKESDRLVGVSTAEPDRCPARRGRPRRRASRLLLLDASGQAASSFRSRSGRLRG